QIIEQQDLRDRRLTDADGSDFVGLDQLDSKIGEFAENLRQRCSRHPAGGPAADDRNLAEAVFSQKTNSGSSGAADRCPSICARNSPCVGRRSAVWRMPTRSCSSAEATFASSSASATGSYSSGTMPCPNMTATQLGVANSSS